MNILKPDQLNSPTKFFDDIQMIGKHYLIWTKKGNLRRHYTISNCLDPLVYRQYLKLISTCEQPKLLAGFNLNELLQEYKLMNEFVVTIKQYA